MANISDYLDWRGDLTFAQAPFNEVDNLILSELTYLELAGIVPSIQESNGGARVTLAQVGASFAACEPPTNLGIILAKSLPPLLQKAAQSRRFGDIKLSHYETSYDSEEAKQFAAVTFETGDKCAYLAFRGTDDTLAGWKEDFLMSCMPQIPAQRLAVQYVKEVAVDFPRRKLRLGGHSKGGNIAVYGAVFAPASIQRRIVQIYSNDGPGFHQATLALPGYTRMADRIFSIVPESSVVGMFLQHQETYTVVKSNQLGLMQHDGFTWEVLGDSFVHVESVSRGSQLDGQAIHQWLEQFTFQQREEFVDTLFQILTASGAETLADLREGKVKTVTAMVRALRDMDKDSRRALLHAVRMLLETNLKVRFDELDEG